VFIIGEILGKKLHLTIPPEFKKRLNAERRKENASEINDSHSIGTQQAGNADAPELMFWLAQVSLQRGKSSSVRAVGSTSVSASCELRSGRPIELSWPRLNNRTEELQRLRRD
jgi:hypothetical protein